VPGGTCRTSPRSIPMTSTHPDGRRRILIVSRGLDSVGTGRQIELVADGLLAAGWEVHLAVTTAGGDVATRLACAGCRLHRLATRPVVDMASAARLAWLARGLRPRTILAWGCSQVRLAGGLRPFLPHTRLVGWVGRQPRGFMTGLALRRPDRVIVSSPAVEAACRRLGVPTQRIDTVIPGARPAEPAGLSRGEIATRLGIDPGKIWTLCVAPLEAESRLERLLWAIDQLGVVHRGLEHVLVGSGPLRARLLHRARAQQLAERLHLFPHLDCLPDLLPQVRLVWQSGEVACGGALLDGMALGVPAVAVTSESARQLIADGETGRIVAADPESEFPRRALGIIEDDALGARYGEAARARAAAEFPADRMVAGVIAACDH